MHATTRSRNQPLGKFYNKRRHFVFILIFFQSSQIGHPIHEGVVNKFPLGGYNRHRRLRGRGKAAPTTTTERPFVRVWNSLIRSVQPNFGLRNLTNPLVNLFNNGNANFIETVPLQAENFADSQDSQQKPQSPIATTRNPNKRKRKRRKQQKQRPTYDSVEQIDDPFDYYGPDYMRLSLVQQQQPMFYYGSNLGSYYDTRRLQALNDYNHQIGYYDPQFAAGSDTTDELDYTSGGELGKLNTKKITVLRPLALAVKLSSNDPTTVDSETNTKEGADDAAIVVASNDDDVDVSVGDKPEGSNSSIPNDISIAGFTGSMRNALGTYMRDDLENRQRQRQSENKVDTKTSIERPRQWQHLLFTARLFK